VTVVTVMMMWRRRWRPILRKRCGLCHDADTQQKSCGELNDLFHACLDAIDSFKVKRNICLAQGIC
jgi:hypothetical protein